jgi:hypothetical protein
VESNPGPARYHDSRRRAPFRVSRDAIGLHATPLVFSQACCTATHPRRFSLARVPCHPRCHRRRPWFSSCSWQFIGCGSSGVMGGSPATSRPRILRLPPRQPPKTPFPQITPLFGTQTPMASATSAP